jgi:hypothetical protein
LLVSWCAGGRCGMACSDEDRGRSRRPSAEDREWSHRSGTRWPGGRVVSCAVCTWHVETRSTGFLVGPQNQDRRFVSGLASKPLGRFSPSGLKTGGRRFLSVWPQNQGGGGFSGFGLKTGSSGLVIWVSKSPVSWFGPQNQVGFGLSVAPQNRRREVGMGHMLRSSGLLGVEASLAKVS